MTSLEEKLRSVRSSMQEMQLRSLQQKQTISELQAKNSQQSVEMDSLRRRKDELQQVRTHCCWPHLLIFFCCEADDHLTPAGGPRQHILITKEKWMCIFCLNHTKNIHVFSKNSLKFTNDYVYFNQIPFYGSYGCFLEPQ